MRVPLIHITFLVIVPLISNASNVYSNLALGLSMTDSFHKHIQGYSTKQDVLFVKHLKYISGIANHYRRINPTIGQPISIDYNVLQDMDGWFYEANIIVENHYDSEKVIKQAFKRLIAAMPIDMAKTLVEVKHHRSGNLLVPKIYGKISKFGKNLANSAAPPMYFVSHSSIKDDKFDEQSVKLDTYVGRAEIPYKLDMIFAELDQKYYSIFPVINDGSLQWEFVSTVVQSSWRGLAYIDSKILSDGQFAANLSNKKVLFFYRRSDQVSKGPFELIRQYSHRPHRLAALFVIFGGIIFQTLAKRIEALPFSEVILSIFESYHPLLLAAIVLLAVRMCLSKL